MLRAMIAKEKPRFDLTELLERAGANAFARGEAYFQDGQVDILSIDARSVLAQVTGTEHYRTQLTGHGKKFDGECSCPAFGDWGFCKHLVAVALAANAAGGDAAIQGTSTLDRIRNHLTAQGVDTLVAMIVDLAERDPTLFRKLDMAATSASADEKTVAARLRKAIDAAIRTDYYVDYRGAGDWAGSVDEALDAIASQASGSRAPLVLDLAVRAIDGIEQAIERIDDSDGHCGGLLERARDIHLTAASVAKPDPLHLARDLFVQETEGDYDTFRGAAQVYAEVLGEVGLTEYRRLATEAWEKLPPRSGSKARQDYHGNYQGLSGILDFFAERDGDVDLRIALRAKDLSSSWNYLQLAEFCIAHGRSDEAIRHAEEGLWLFEDVRADERLVLFAAEHLSRACRQEDATRHVWRAFEKAPSLELYRRLRTLGGVTGRDRAVTFLEAGLAKQQASTWYFPADLLIQVLMLEKKFDAAWAIVHQHKASMGLKETLARASEATHPTEALAIYSQQVDQLVDGGGNPAYEKATGLIARMAALCGAAEQLAYVTALKQRFGRKRNFMKLLA